MYIPSKHACCQARPKTRNAVILTYYVRYINRHVMRVRRSGQFYFPLSLSCFPIQRPLNIRNITNSIIMMYMEDGILKMNLSVMKASIKIVMPIMFSMRPSAALRSKKLPPLIKRGLIFVLPRLPVSYIMLVNFCQTAQPAFARQLPVFNISAYIHRIKPECNFAVHLR
jgi:hypothetical protein